MQIPNQSTQDSLQHFLKCSGAPTGFTSLHILHAVNAMFFKNRFQIYLNVGEAWNEINNYKFYFWKIPFQIVNQTKNEVTHAGHSTIKDHSHPKLPMGNKKNME